MAKREGMTSKRRKGSAQLPNPAIEAFIKKIDGFGVEGLKKEFNEIKGYKPKERKTTAFGKNETRNRYKDVICYDETRVILNLEVPPETDYIHANWVKLPDVENTFIATQAPLENTTSDFWRMVFQENVGTILMLCRLEEKGKQRCPSYWPTEQGSSHTYGPMFVNTKKVDRDDKQRFNTYILEVLPEGCSNSNIVKLIQMLDWPDEGSPINTFSVLRLLQSIKKSKDPCVVHCSAGTGRTGTVILAAAAISKLMKNKAVDMKKLLCDIRDKRASSIETHFHYAFAHLIVCAYITVKFHNYHEILKFHDDCEKMNK